MSDRLTPETDKFETKYWDNDLAYVDDIFDFARSLEQERDEAKDIITDIWIVATSNHRSIIPASIKHLPQYIESIIKSKLKLTPKNIKELERERDKAKAEATKWKSAFESIESAGAEQAQRAEKNREWALKAEAERDHWKANHDNQVSLKAAIASRPDLKDRSEKVQSLERALREAWLLMDDIEGNESMDEWQNKYSKYMPSYRCPECDALASHGANDGPCEQHKSQ